MFNHPDRTKREAFRRTTVYIHNVGGDSRFNWWYPYYLKQLLIDKPYPFSWQRARDLRYPLCTRLYWKVYDFFYQWIKYKLPRKYTYSIINPHRTI